MQDKLFIQYKFINDFNLVYAIMVIIFLHLNNIFQNLGSICILNLISNLKFRFQRKCLIDQDYKELNLKPTFTELIIIEAISRPFNNDVINE